MKATHLLAVTLLLALTLADGRSAGAETTQADIEALYFQADELKGNEKVAKVKEILALRSPHAVPFLIRLMRDRQDLSLIRNEILANIELVTDERFITEIDDLTKIEEQDLRVVALRALGHVPGAKATEKLIQLVDQEDPVIRTAALAALGTRARPEAAAFLRDKSKSGLTTAPERAAAQYALDRQESALEPVPKFQPATIYERAPIAVATQGKMPGWALPSEWHLRGMGFGGSCGGSEWQLAPRRIDSNALGEGLDRALDGCSFLAVLGLEDEFSQSLFAASEGGKSLHAFLSRGGCVFFDHGSVNTSVKRWLESLGLTMPAPTQDRKGPNVAVALEDFHPIMEFPFLLSRVPLEKTFGTTWTGWDQTNFIAPWRNSARPEHAALLICPKVLGKGTIILSGIPGYLGFAEARHNLYSFVLDPQKTWAERFHFEASDEIATPHTPWGRPLSGEKLRALFIVPSYGHREMVEIAQRLDLDYDFVPLIDMLNGSHQQRWGPWAFRKNPRDRFSAAAPTHLMLEHYWRKPYDAMVIGQYTGFYPSGLPRPADCSLFPESLRARILRRVSEGMGLVTIGLSGHGTRFRMADGLEYAPPPKFVELAWPGREPGEFGKHVSCAPFGKGRIALVDAQTSFARGTSMSLGPAYQVPGARGPYTQLNVNDYYYSALAKLLLWAGGRPMPSKRIEEITASSDAVIVRLGGEQAEKAKPSAALAVRDRFNEVVHSHQTDLAALETRLELPKLPAGAYVAELRVLDDKGRAMDWAAVQFAVSSAVRIAELEPDREFYRPGDRADVKVRFEGEVPDGSSVEALAADPWGRQVLALREEIPRASKEAKLSFPIEHPVTAVWHLSVALAVNEQMVDREVLPLYIVRPEDPGNLPFYLGKLERYVEAAELGVDLTHFPSTPGKADEALGVGVRTHVGWAFLGSLIGSPTTFPPDAVRSPCLSSPTFERGIRHHLARVIPPLAKLGVRSYELQDETSFGGFYCFSPHCLARFRRWLRDEYLTIDALNRSWGAEFKAWQEVRPAMLEEAVKTGRFASWIDHRTFMEDVLAGWVELAQNCIREHVPDARVGLSGTYGIGIGAFDWWKLSRVCTVAVKYGGTGGREYHRSFDRGDQRLGNWGRYAYDMTDYQETFARYGPWEGLFEGENSFWFWGGYGSMRFDLHPTNAVRWSAEEVREIRQGIDTFCLSHLDGYGIGVHYSQNSLQLHHAYREKLKETNFGHSHSTFINPLKRLGYGFDYVSYQQVELGDLRDRGFRLFFLPGSACLSQSETDELRKFVENGGTLVSDFPPGQYDRHGNPRDARSLEEVFGVKFGPGFAAAPPAAALSLDLEFPKDAIRTARYDPKLTLDGAKALGKVGAAPAFTIHESGKGRAILLNFSPEMLTSGAQGEDEDAGPLDKLRRELVAQLVDLAGVTPPARVTGPDGEPFDGNVALFRRGDNLMLGFGAKGTYGRVSDQEPYEVGVDLDRPRFVYDVRRRKSVGRVTEFRVQATPSVAEMYGLLPYEVHGLKMELNGEARQGAPARFGLALTASGTAGAHVLTVQVTDATGRERPEYAGDVVAPRGQATFSFPLAMNEPTGEWTLSVRDVASGVTTNLKFSVRGSEQP